MKKAVLICLLAAAGGKSQPPEQTAIAAYMKEAANDPASYEPISFRFLGPATYDNTGVIAGDNTRTGDLYEHTFRAKNGFGALILSTKVFAIQHGEAFMLPDSLSERASTNFNP